MKGVKVQIKHASKKQNINTIEQTISRSFVGSTLNRKEEVLNLYYITETRGVNNSLYMKELRN